MRIVFFGSGQFGLPSLEALRAKGAQVLCVVTQPDRKKGRGMHLGYTPIKEYALRNGIEVFQPEKVNQEGALKRLAALAPDLLVVIAYGQILSQEILDLPKVYAVNLHASLLPAYRGAAPINWALIRGETQTGVTVIKMSRAMDAGPVIAQAVLPIEPGDDAYSLSEKLARAGALTLMQAFDDISQGRAALAPQDPAKVTMAPKLHKDTGNIRWEACAQEIANLVRGCSDWPGAFTTFRGRQLTIMRAHPQEAPHRLFPGEVAAADKHGISVATGKGFLVVEELRPEGARRMSARDFIAGHRIAPGDILKPKK